MTNYVFSERAFYADAHVQKFGTVSITSITEVEDMTEDDLLYVVGDVKSEKGKEVMDFVEIMGIPVEEMIPEMLWFDGELL